MKASFYFRCISLALIVNLISACNLPQGVENTALPQPSATPEVQVQPGLTDTLQPVATETAIETATVPVLQEQDTQVPEPALSCTVLQDLNLRSGPGTAYRPPIKILPANTIVIPEGFNPQGIPGGSWVLVQDPANQEKGWLSAGSQYVSCNLDLTTLPSVAVGTPPPPPLPRSAISSTPDGNCGDEYKCDVVFSDESFVQFRVLKNGKELTQDDGVEQVSFTVSTLDGKDIYTSTETTAAYCIFGGNSPCNPWVVEDYVYKWKAGGATAQAGEYNVEILASVNGNSLRWAANFKLVLP